MSQGSGIAPILLLRLKLQITPQIFEHRIWVNFNLPNQLPSSQLIQDLEYSARQYETEGDILSSCQILLLCAALQKQMKHIDAARNCLQHILHISENEELPQFKIYALWGLSSISFISKDFQSIDEYLSSLQKVFGEEGDWLLSNLIALINRSIKEPREDESFFYSIERLFMNWGSSDRELDTTFLTRIGDISTSRLETDPKIVYFIERLFQFLRSSWNRIIQSHGIEPGSQIAEFKPVGNQAQIPLESSEVGTQSGNPTEVSARPPPTKPVSRPDTPTMTIYCLGRFQVFLNDRIVENWLSRKGSLVFKYLLIHHPKPVGKEILMDTIWRDTEADAARRNLHQAIYSLRQTLRGKQEAFHHIWFKNDSYFLNPEMELWLDFKAFEKGIQEARHFEEAGRIQEAIKQYETAEALYQGDFLEEDLYEDWLAASREYMLTQYLGAVDRLSKLYLQVQQYAAVIHLCRKVLEKDRCYEAAHRRLMKCYLAQGQRQLAIRQYQICVQSLREELNILPSEKTRSLYERIVSYVD